MKKILFLFCALLGFGAMASATTVTDNLTVYTDAIEITEAVGATGNITITMAPDESASSVTLSFYAEDQTSGQSTVSASAEATVTPSKGSATWTGTIETLFTSAGLSTYDYVTVYASDGTSDDIITRIEYYSGSSQEITFSYTYRAEFNDQLFSQITNESLVITFTADATQHSSSDDCGLKIGACYNEWEGWADAEIHAETYATEGTYTLTASDIATLLPEAMSSIQSAQIFSYDGVVISDFSYSYEAVPATEDLVLNIAGCVTGNLLNDWSSVTPTVNSNYTSVDVTIVTSWNGFGFIQTSWASWDVSGYEKAVLTYSNLQADQAAQVEFGLQMSDGYGVTAFSTAATSGSGTIEIVFADNTTAVNANNQTLEEPMNYSNIQQFTVQGSAACSFTVDEIRLVAPSSGSTEGTSSLPYYYYPEETIQITGSDVDTNKTNDETTDDHFTILVSSEILSGVDLTGADAVDITFRTNDGYAEQIPWGTLRVSDGGETVTTFGQYGSDNKEFAAGENTITFALADASDFEIMADFSGWSASDNVATFVGVVFYDSTAGTPDAPTSIKTVKVADPDAVEVARYNLAGQKLSGAQKGINIVVYSDGSSKKVLVK